MGVIGLIDMTAFFCKPFGLMLGCLIDTLKFSQKVCKEGNHITGGMFLLRWEWLNWNNFFCSLTSYSHVLMSTVG